jgi:hypothetical protein
MNTPESKQIMTRFYEAIDAIITKKEIRGIATYCRLYEIDRRNFIANRKNMDLGRFELSWMTPVVKDFGVNATWLLTGRGKMFK